MSNGKKFTQTTLSCFIKPKTASNQPKQICHPKTPLIKKRPTPPTELKPTCGKKSKLSEHVNSKYNTDAKDGYASEPEVSSSSESAPMVSPVQKNQTTPNTLLPFIQLSRCDEPASIEVTSSTESDDVIVLDTSNPSSILKSSHNAEPLAITPVKKDLSNAETSTEVSSPPGDSSSFISPDVSLDRKTPTTATKSASLSVKKRQEAQKAAVEEKKKQREEEREKKRVQKLEEKQRKEREAEEAKRVKAEQKLKEKEEKQKLKEELQAKKQTEIDAKNAAKEAERQRKEEIRLKKEEEKRLKDLERNREKEEKQKAIQAQQNALLRFIQKPVKEASEEVQEPEATANRFKPFCPKADMKLAVLHRVPPINHEVFDKAVTAQSPLENTYFSELKTNGARSSPSTWPWSEEDISLVSTFKASVKFLQFHTDVRPAYFGTWRKKSEFIKPRRPFGEDKERFDYENDSADEWEEEEPGESVDSGDDEEEKDEFDFDPELREDGFLVDHNYLSDGEGGASDDEETIAAKKTKQMIARTYGKRNRKINKLKPTVYGTVWQQEGSSEPHLHAQRLLTFSAILFEPCPIEFTTPVKSSPDNPEAASAAKKSRIPVPEEAIPDLIRAVHGCVKGMKVIIKAFQKSWEKKTSVLLPKKGLKAMIQSIASYQRETSRCMWLVKEELLLKYSLSDLPVPNPAYNMETPAKPLHTPMQVESTPDPLEVSSTLKPRNSSTLKQSNDSSQKRMTEFVKPAKKRLKVENLDTRNISSPDSSFHALDESPVTFNDPLNSANAVANQKELPGSKVELVVLSDSPQISKPAASKTSATASIPSKPETPSTRNNAAPRRITLTPIAFTTKTVSPRRIPLTTISTPPKQPQTSIQKKVTPTSGSQSSKSPRRVNFTTLSKSDVELPANLLTPRSQNMPDNKPDSSPAKARVIK